MSKIVLHNSSFFGPCPLPDFSDLEIGNFKIFRAVVNICPTFGQHLVNTFFHNPYPVIPDDIRFCTLFAGSTKWFDFRCAYRVVVCMSA